MIIRMGKNHKYTSRKGDIIGLWILGILLLIQVVRVFVAVCADDYDPVGDVVSTPYKEAFSYSLLLYPSAFIVAFGGLICYLLRSKENGPIWPSFYSNNPVLATIFGSIYFLALFAFCVYSFLVSGMDREEIVIGWLFTMLPGVPADIIGAILWRKRFYTKADSENKQRIA